MDILTLLDSGESAGLVIRLDGDRLHITGPREAGSIAQSIGKRKPEVTCAWWCWQARRLLGQIEDTDTRQDMADCFDEIAASREYEHELDRQEAEQVALGAMIVEMCKRGLPIAISINQHQPSEGN